MSDSWNACRTPSPGNPTPHFHVETSPRAAGLVQTARHVSQLSAQRSSRPSSSARQVEVLCDSGVSRSRAKRDSQYSRSSRARYRSSKMPERCVRLAAEGQKSTSFA